ncbi:MAG TPA: matrixin family metalloprotease [Candidatus Limnocylindrales bacterium]|jgi:hypothetical protein
MHSFLRSALALSFSLILLSGPLPARAAASSASPSLTAHVEELRLAPRQAAARADRRAFVAPPPCEDRAYNLEGGRWTSTYQWWFRASSTPSRLGKRAAEAAIKRGVANITKARNDCGRADGVSAKQSYRGRTSAKPSCSRTDGRNVIGFRPLAADVAARACWWISGNRIVEADIQVNSDIGWATSLAGCAGELMLEAVLTHEAGHVFGLAHVGESRHGRLTMSPYIDGTCNNQEATLGLGDMRGLEALYP